MIGRKQVDITIFSEGTRIPMEFWPDFSAANDNISPEQSQPITLVIDGAEYEARLLRHHGALDTKAGFMLSFSSNPELRRVLRDRLAFSYQYLKVNKDERERIRRIDIPVQCREYLEFYGTEIPFRYDVKIVAVDASAQIAGALAATDFEHVWADLRELVEAEGLVPPLTIGLPYELRWVDGEGIAVTMDGKVSLVLRTNFELIWSRLQSDGIMATDEFPDVARPQGGAIAAVLARLPYIGYCVYPGLTLFNVAHQFTNDQIGRLFNVATQGSIRYAGSAAQPHHVVFVDDPTGATRAGGHYRNWWDDDTFYYSGEETRGNQKLSAGNLALKSSVDGNFPIFGFSKQSPNNYQYIGRFKVIDVREKQQPANGEEPRLVYTFVMRRVEGIGRLSSRRQPLMFRMEAPLDPLKWSDCLENNHMAIAVADGAGDLREYTEIDGWIQDYYQTVGGGKEWRRSLMYRQAKELWQLRNLQPGDYVAATRGTSAVVALGVVSEPGYSYVGGKHMISIEWKNSAYRRIPPQSNWATELVSPVSEPVAALILAKQSDAEPPRLEMAVILAQFSALLRESGLYFGQGHEAIVLAFLAGLATKPFAILTGLSGSGKTRIAMGLGQWFGSDKYVVLPVRPDWTGPEWLLGYPDALRPTVGGRSAWHVPQALEFILRAARDPEQPYLLILDEMNLAHVERYFADFLSGMESGQPCVPNLFRSDGDEHWRTRIGEEPLIAVPDNLFVVGTVNIDETTYVFSPKVLDRANTFEFRVHTEDLILAASKPKPCEPGDTGLVRGFLCIATDDEWQAANPCVWLDDYRSHLRVLHSLLAQDGFEFGHRTYYEAVRYAAILAAGGVSAAEQALDQQVMQKILPRLHGTRRRLEGILCNLGEFCFYLGIGGGEKGSDKFDPEEPPVGSPLLPRSFDKIRRMTHRLRINQFASFAE